MLPTYLVFKCLQLLHPQWWTVRWGCGMSPAGRGGSTLWQSSACHLFSFRVCCNSARNLVSKDGTTMYRWAWWKRFAGGCAAVTRTSPFSGVPRLVWCLYQTVFGWDQNPHLEVEIRTVSHLIWTREETMALCEGKRFGPLASVHQSNGRIEKQV